MTRISRPQMWMMMARAASLRSTCFRLNVGCVIVENDRKVVSVGYNGPPSGQPHCTGNDCPGQFQCHQTIHAEKNAIQVLEFDTPEGKMYDLYTTHSPCEPCCSIIQAAPIKQVFFETEYRNTAHLTSFKSSWELYQITPAGYVVEWFSKKVVELA
jgi:dCMP deaminase